MCDLIKSAKGFLDPKRAVMWQLTYCDNEQCYRYYVTMTTLMQEKPFEIWQTTTDEMDYFLPRGDEFESTLSLIFTQRVVSESTNRNIEVVFNDV